MGTMEGLLQEMKSVTKRTLIKLDHKRRPPERLPEVIYYGADIPRELQDRFLLEGGFSYFEGTPLMIALIWKSQITIQGFLFTTVGVYACENYTKIDSDAYTTAPPEYPVRYDRYREIRPTKEPGGYFGDRFEMHGKDGSEEVVYGSIYATYFTEVMSRILPLVPKEVPQERKKTPLIPNEKKQNSAAEEWVCPNCGNRAFGNFCANCGRPRQERKSEPKPEPKPEPTPKSDAKPKAKETFKTDIEWKQELDTLPNLVFANPKMLSITQIWSQDRKTLLFQASPGAEDREVPPNVRDKKSYTNAECCWYAQKLARAGECDMAAELLKYAMRKGSDDAYFMLGMQYLDHQLSTDHREDLPRAHGLIVQAAHKGNEMAKGMIRDLYFTEADFPGSVPEKWRQPHRRGKTDYTEAIKLLAAGKKVRCLRAAEKRSGGRICSCNVSAGQNGAG